MARVRHPDDSKALRLLDLHAGSSKSRPAQLSTEYLRAIARCEALPENQNGSDKSWVERSRREFRQHYARVKRVR